MWLASTCIALNSLYDEIQSLLCSLIAREPHDCVSSSNALLSLFFLSTQSQRSLEKSCLRQISVDRYFRIFLAQCLDKYVITLMWACSYDWHDTTMRSIHSAAVTVFTSDLYLIWILFTISITTTKGKQWSISVKHSWVIFEKKSSYFMYFL